MTHPMTAPIRCLCGTRTLRCRAHVYIGPGRGNALRLQYDYPLLASELAL